MMEDIAGVRGRGRREGTVPITMGKSAERLQAPGICSIICAQQSYILLAICLLASIEGENMSMSFTLTK
jgi:hypothetical protein